MNDMPAEECPGRVAPGDCPAHSGVCATLGEHDRRLNVGEKRMASIEDKVDDIRTRLLSRPSWPVTVMLTFLVGLCTFLGTSLISTLTEERKAERTLHSLERMEQSGGYRYGIDDPD